MTKGGLECNIEAEERIHTSGHSKWSTIKRQKGAADIKRGMTFTRLASAITIAAKAGSSGDPQSNPRLRQALDEARAQNMPKENIQRAIERGLGKLSGQAIEEVVFEGFGPHKVAFIIETATDNRARTLQGIKNFFERNGGSLAGPGAVSYMFDKAGELKIKGEGERDEEMLKLIDLGADDLEEVEEDGETKYLVYVESPELNTMSTKLTQEGYKVESKKIIFKPNTLAEITDPAQAEKVVDFTNKLEENEDVTSVYTNL